MATIYKEKRRMGYRIEKQMMVFIKYRNIDKVNIKIYNKKWVLNVLGNKKWSQYEG